MTRGQADLRTAEGEISEKFSKDIEKYQRKLETQLKPLVSKKPLAVKVMPYVLSGSNSSASSAVPLSQSGILRWLLQWTAVWLWATHWALQIGEDHIYELTSDDPYWPPFRRQAKLQTSTASKLEHRKNIRAGPPIHLGTLMVSDKDIPLLGSLNSPQIIYTETDYK